MGAVLLGAAVLICRPNQSTAATQPNATVAVAGAPTDSGAPPPVTDDGARAARTDWRILSDLRRLDRSSSAANGSVAYSSSDGGGASQNRLVPSVESFTLMLFAGIAFGLCTCCVAAGVKRAVAHCSLLPTVVGHDYPHDGVLYETLLSQRRELEMAEHPACERDARRRGRHGGREPLQEARRRASKE